MELLFNEVGSDILASPNDIEMIGYNLAKITDNPFTGVELMLKEAL